MKDINRNIKRLHDVLPIRRHGKSVQYSLDPEFAFSNGPQTPGNLNVHYPQRIIFPLRNILKVWNSIMLVGTSVRKQNNLQILLTGYEKHFTISNDKELNMIPRNSPLKYT